jgi:hypothetical protein
VGAADTLPDGQNAGVAGRVKRLCNWWANLFADERRLMAPTWFGQVNRSTSTRPPRRIPTGVGAIDDLGVAPFVMRTGVICGGHSGV